MGRVIASYTNVNAVSQIGISRKQKRIRPGKEFACKTVVSYLLLVEYLNNLTLCRKVIKLSSLLCFVLSLLALKVLIKCSEYIKGCFFSSELL